VRIRRRLLPGAAVLALAACLPAPAASAGARTWLRPAVERGPAAVRALAYASPPTAAQCRRDADTDCYTPAQIARAYGTDRLNAAGTTGAGRTICIVDSFGSPTVREDLAAFSAAFGLPDAPLTVVAPAGAVPPYDGSRDRAGWAAETSLDVQWAHALAPEAAIVLIVTPTSETEGIAGFPEIARAVRFAVTHYPCDVLSQSFGATEPTFDSKAQVLALRDEMYKPAVRRGVTLLAAAGDTGPTDYRRDGVHLYGTPVDSWPSSDPLVTSVGGTRLRLTAAGERQAPDTSWGGVAGSDAGGGGLSALFSRPRWQDRVGAVVGARRGTPDVALVAAPQSGLVTYEGFAPAAGNGPWHVEAGTSAATPVFAGIVALACQAAGRRVGWLNPLLYGPLSRPGAGLVDVTAGRTDIIGHAYGDGTPPLTVQGHPATAGYDLATGLGTVDAARLVPALATLAAVRR